MVNANIVSNCIKYGDGGLSCLKCKTNYFLSNNTCIDTCGTGVNYFDITF